MPNRMNGPDWTDIETYLRGMDALHGGTTLLRISAVGIGGSGGLNVEISTTFDVVPGSTEVASIQGHSTWPCKDCRTLEGHIFAGLVKQDYMMSRDWKQQELPLA